MMGLAKNNKQIVNDDHRFLIENVQLVGIHNG